MRRRNPAVRDKPMNPIIYAIPVFLLTIVLEAWIAHRRGLAVYDISDAVTSLHHGVLSQLIGAFTKVFNLGLYVAIFEAYRMTEWSTNNIGLWVLALVLYDLCYYWAHRLGHEVNFFWASHVVHHSSEYYNLSTALRQTSTGALLGWVFYVPLALLGVPPLMLVVVGLIDLLYQYWVHTELVGRLGWLDRVLVTPSNHRVHHGQNDYCIDKNYGGILILWDRLFGTFVDERAGEKIVYGIRTPLHSFSPLWGNLHYYANLGRASLAARGWRAKLGVWVAPPGGWSDAPIAHFETAGFVRFAQATPVALHWYVALQYTLTVPFIVHFLGVVPQLPSADALVYAGGIALSALALGALLDARPWARWTECLRLVVVALAFAALPDWFGFVAAPALRWVVVALAVGSAGWLLRQSPKSTGVAA